MYIRKMGIFMIGFYGLFIREPGVSSLDFSGLDTSIVADSFYMAIVPL
jgi:hypothetical protein